MGYAAYAATGNVAYWGLALSSAFWFMFRYYIKLETIFTEQNRDSTYLEKCSIRRQETYEKIEKRRALIKTPADLIKWAAFIHYRAFNLDETEFITFSVIALLLGKAEYFVLLFGIGQPIIALYRHAQRGYQLTNNKAALLDPMRK